MYQPRSVLLDFKWRFQRVLICLVQFFAVIESSKPSYNNISLHFKQKPEHLEIKVSSTTTFISSAKSLPARCISISQNLLVIYFDVFPHKILNVFVPKCGEKKNSLEAALYNLVKKNDTESVIKWTEQCGHGDAQVIERVNLSVERSG